MLAKVALKKQLAKIFEMVILAITATIAIANGNSTMAIKGMQFKSPQKNVQWC